MKFYMKNQNLVHWVVFLAVSVVATYSLVAVIKKAPEVSVSLSTSSASNETSYSKLANLTTQMLQSPADLSVVQARKQVMLAAMETDPAAVISIALDNPSLGKMPANVRDQLERPVTLSGTLEVEHSDDFENNHSIVDYTLTTTGNQKYQIHFASADQGGWVAGLDLNSTGSRVSVKGIAVDDQVAVGSDRSNYTVTARPQVRGASADQHGEVIAAIARKLLFLLQAPPGTTPFGSVVNVRNYFNNVVIPFTTENSFGKLTLQVDVIGYYPTTNCSSTFSTAETRAWAIAQ